MLAEQLREALPWLRLETDLAGGGVKSQFKRADKRGAELALILGDSELERGVAGVKHLRGDVLADKGDREGARAGSARA